MFPRPGRLWPRGRVHATFTPNIMGLTLQQIHSLEVGWVDWLGMCARLSFLDAIEDSVNGEVVWHGTLALKSHDEEWKFGKCGQNPPT